MFIRPAGPCHPNSAMVGLFSYYGNTHSSFPGGHYDLTPPCGGGGHTGDFQISGTWTRLDHKLHISCLELKAVISAIHQWDSVLQDCQVFYHYILYNSSFLYQQTRRDTFSFLAASSNGSSYVATRSEHGSHSQAHPCCLNVGDCDPSLGNSDSGHFCHVQSTSPSFLSSNLQFWSH